MNLSHFFDIFGMRINSFSIESFVIEKYWLFYYKIVRNATILTHKSQKFWLDDHTHIILYSHFKATFSCPWDLVTSSYSHFRNTLKNVLLLPTWRIKLNPFHRLINVRSIQTRCKFKNELIQIRFVVGFSDRFSEVLISLLLRDFSDILLVGICALIFLFLLCKAGSVRICNKDNNGN